MLKQRLRAGWAGLSRLSIKNRLQWGFVAIMVMAASSFVFLMDEDHRGATENSEIALRAHQESANAIRLQEILTQIERSAQNGGVNPSDVDHFRRLVDHLESTESVPEAKAMLELLQARFDDYLRASAANPKSSQRQYEDVAATAGAYTELHLNSIFRMADQIRRRQDQTLYRVFVVLGLVLLVIGIIALRLITLVTRPLSSLASYLDGFDIESDTVLRLPGSNMPELRRVARGFEQLLEKLRGYRALNVRRLLIEKRRTDIMTASISDGIFLLKGDDVLYLNPVAERIMGGLGTSKLQGGLSGLASRTDVSKQTLNAARAVLSAAIQAMPVEFALETEERTFHYLIHALPISFDLLEQVGPSEARAGDRLGLQPDRLVVARDVTLMRESQEAKGHFLATLSHEVKTPVTSLTLATRMLKRTTEQVPGLTPTQRALIDTCVEDVDRLRGLLDELLTVSRFDVLTQRMQFQQADLAKLVRHSVQSFREQAFEKGAGFEIRFGPRVRKRLMISIDPTKIAWAFSNLLTNALRHTPRGGTVEVSLDINDEDCVELSVADHGPGIDKKRQDRIFDRFNSYYDIRVARSGSAGTGLAIAREIVQAHGGRIWVISESGRGAQFCFTLPLKRKPGDAVQSEGGNGKVAYMKGVGSGASARS